MSSTEIEIQTFPASAIDSEGSAIGKPTEEALSGSADGSGPGVSLPPVDRGKDAYLFLAACFAVEALVWGFPFAFGVFQDYYTSHEPFAGSSNIAIIGTSQMGVMYLTAPIFMGCGRMFPSWARWSSFAGLLIMSLSLAMSSFATNVTGLIVSQGVCYAIGGGITYAPCILYMDEWFVQRKGQAFGIMWAGTGLAGVVLPLFLEYVLNNIGYQSTLRLWAGLLFLLTAPLAFFIKPRVPVSMKATIRVQPFNMAFLKLPVFLLYQAANVIEAVGYFLPGIYLPVYARTVLGAPPFAAATTVLLVNVASVFGCIAMGWFTDRFHVTICILISTIGSTLGVFLFWGFASSIGMLYTFCIFYGLFAGSFTSTWPGIMTDVVRKAEASGQGYVDPVMVFSWLAAGRGIGNVLSGPISDKMVQGLPWKNAGEIGFGYFSGYGDLIVLTGVTAFIGGISFVWKRFGLV